MNWTFDDSLPTTMVMEEMPTPRDTHILLRGEYDKKGPKVCARPAGCLAAAADRCAQQSPRLRPVAGRSKSNPLTARVAVNRFWQMLFGAGIVKTVEDFGAQGEWPSHPELLDWLAVEFMVDWKRQGWDVEGSCSGPSSPARRTGNPRKAPRICCKRDPDNRLLAAARVSGCRPR